MYAFLSSYEESLFRSLFICKTCIFSCSIPSRSLISRVFFNIFLPLSLSIIFFSFTKSEQIKVPDVAGLSESDAIEKLQDKGFEIKTTIEETSTKVEEGDVIRTKPSASTKLKKGSEITLYVSKGIV